MKGFADDSFKFDENGRRFAKWVEDIVGKGEMEKLLVTNSVFKRLVLEPSIKPGHVWGRVNLNFCRFCDSTFFDHSPLALSLSFPRLPPPPPTHTHTKVGFHTCSSQGAIIVNIKQSVCLNALKNNKKKMNACHEKEYEPFLPYKPVLTHYKKKWFRKTLWKKEKLLKWRLT